MTSLGCHGVSNHCQFVCFIQQLVPASHNRIIKVLRYRYSPTINTANHLISLSLILSVMNELPSQWFYTIQRKAFRGIFKQLIRIIPVSYILDLFIISTGSADAQVRPAWHHQHTQGCISTAVFDWICFIKTLTFYSIWRKLYGHLLTS